MDRCAKVLLYTLDRIDSLRRRGLVEGEPALTDEGREQLKALIASGFKPTLEEIRQATLFLARSGR